MKFFDTVRFSGTADEVSAQWHEQRHKGVGGSDVATILGLNKWRTPYDLWLEKTGRETPGDISDKPAIMVGNWLEPELRREFAARHPELSVTEPHAMYRSVQHPCMQASLDGVLHEKGARGITSYGVLEIKTVGESRSSDWDDGIPAYYLTQVTHYLAVTGWQWGIVFVLVGNREMREYRFERDEDDITSVVDACETFWNNFVATDIPPELTGMDVDRLYPNDDGDIEHTDSVEFDGLVDEYKHVTDEQSELKKRKEAISNQLKPMVGEHAGLRSARYQVTYKTTHYKESFRPARDARVLRTSEIKEK